MIRVLVVDDSRLYRSFLERLLSSDPEIHVIGAVDCGQAALDFLRTHQPDVITMDIQMPDMDGFKITRTIMETNPVPIVIISAIWTPQEVAKTFQAMEAGAVAILEKTPGTNRDEHATSRDELIDTIKQASQAKVKRLRSRSQPQKNTYIPMMDSTTSIPEIVALGASTGGPPAIQLFLKTLPQGFPVPILIVQHISSGFTEGFAEWLRVSTNHRIKIAVHGDSVKDGGVFLAPEGRHMGIHSHGLIYLSDDPLEHLMRPSVSFLFRSVAKNYGKRSVGVLLTGMGVDGALELKQIRDAGGITFAQDAESAIIHGMPGEAIRLGGASYALNPVSIAKRLLAIVDQQT